MAEGTESNISKPGFLMKMIALILCGIGLAFIYYNEHQKADVGTSVFKYFTKYRSTNVPKVSFLWTKISLAYGAVASLAGIVLMYVAEEQDSVRSVLTGTGGLSAVVVGCVMGTKFYSQKLQPSVLTIAYITVIAGVAMLIDAGLLLKKKAE